MIKPDPMIAACNAISERMDALMLGDASRSQWDKAADIATVLATLADLHAAIPIGVPANEFARRRERHNLDRLFHIAHVTVHYEFECDFHAIVFFDSKGRQIYARM